jgi:methylenetetrahydrofolate dehydrogenase (NADP+)/methenyltetrahydrofolate cyclohydrolase
MSAQVIDGLAVAAKLRKQIAVDAATFAEQYGRPPGLATILIGDDPASAVYVASKQRACAAAGIEGFSFNLPADATREQAIATIEEANANPAISGIICQLPVPHQLDGVELTGLVDPLKDVDGLTTTSAGLLALGRPGLRPCTPRGVLMLLDEVGVELEGAEAVVIGRSNLFGKPMGQLLLERSATVTICHSRTKDLAATCARADVLIAAVGRARMVEANFVKAGAVVIDVGINRVDGALCGDVDFEAVSEVASAITPVPGGVGPMTIACLLDNTVIAARMAAEQA